MRIRKERFEFARDPKFWDPGNPMKTYFFNAFSLIIPNGEHFFMRAVNHFGKQLFEGEDRRHLAIFLSQEANHGRMHDELNVVIRRHYAFSARYDRFYDRLLRTFIYHGRKHELVCTVALEYLTYILAKLVLRDGLLAPSSAETYRFWVWHALEEIDHKSVASELADRLKISHLRRCLTMLWILIPLVAMLLYGMGVQAAQDGELNLRGLRKFWRLMVSEDGVVSRGLRELFAYFQPRHRPADFSDEPFVAAFEEQFRVSEGPRSDPLLAAG